MITPKWSGLSCQEKDFSFDEIRGRYGSLQKQRYFVWRGARQRRASAQLKSVFHDDMFVLDLGTRKWYSLVMNPASVVDGEGARDMTDSVFEGLKDVTLDGDVSEEGAGS